MRSFPAYVNLIPTLAPGPVLGIRPAGRARTPDRRQITMAKNKNRDRKQPQSERSQEAAQQTSMQTQAHERATQVTPGDVARKGRQKRFGHN